MEGEEPGTSTSIWFQERRGTRDKPLNLGPGEWKNQGQEPQSGSRGGGGTRDNHLNMGPEEGRNQGQVPQSGSRVGGATRDKHFNLVPIIVNGLLVTLVVDWLFLPQNFGPVVENYEGIFLLCECTLGGGYISKWWGHLTSICCHQYFSHHRWWGPQNLVWKSLC